MNYDLLSLSMTVETAIIFQQLVSVNVDTVRTFTQVPYLAPSEGSAMSIYTTMLQMRWEAC